MYGKLLGAILEVFKNIFLSIKVCTACSIFVIYHQKCRSMLVSGSQGFLSEVAALVLRQCKEFIGFSLG